MSNVFDNFNGDIRNWKGILIGTIVTIVNVAIIFLIDGFLLHPIPAPEGTFSFSGGSYAEFDLAEAVTGYSNDNIIDTYFPNDERIYLVRQGDELHLLEFRVHRYTKRSSLKRDLTVESEGTQTFRLGGILDPVTVEISDGRITDTNASAPILTNDLRFLYVLIAILLAAFEVTLFNYLTGRA